ncbi:putative ankyrin repeat protein [Botrytis fragariae]|uniref:Putative ankyrin repeat protein n=1 Tax=Botrytis fragariae TaxID=1964551 RepID=A0A8H6ANG6_9HELO|nr:putative ankyrin repeat protein [Botrytis fragariae]KAF5870500.1 putative ankyrin repeat protein [Botrytis fragariae]
MAEALGVASSIAGLVSLADTVVRLGYKYIRDVKDAEKSVQNLVEEVNNLSGVLHSLDNVAQALETQDNSVHSSSKIQHLYSCQTTLEKITDQLEKAIPAVKSTSQKLKWPFKKAAISELLKEIQNHKSTMIMALNTQQMSTLIEILANQEQLNEGVAAINARMEASRKERQRLAADERVKKKLNLLGTIDVMKWQNSNIRLRQPGTGVWFTESKDFKDWASTGNSKLWIHGIPGAGKTILMASVIKEIEQTQDSSHGLAMFYCDYKDTQTHDSRIILGALARQLILQHEDAFTQLEAFCEKHHMTETTQGSATTDDLCEFIVELSRNFSTTSIVVDGLDEIAEDRAEVTGLLKSLNKPSGTIKTLLASRNEVDIRNILEDYPCVSIAAKSGDLRLYVHSEIEKRTKLGKLRIRDHNLKDHIVKVLTEGADGMFRWVACQMDYLCECSTDRDRREALRKLPPNLPKSYERILDRVNRSSKENQTLVRHTLLWVVYAEEPLSIAQLLQALAVRPGDETFEKENMTTLDELLNWCSSLIRQKSQSDELELAHFTVKEYLLSLSEEYGPGLSQYRISGDHAEIVRMCCDFLSLSEFDGMPLPVTNLKPELADFDEAWEDFERNYSFIDYVLRFWACHVHQSTWSEISNDVLLLFDETRSSYRLWTFGRYHYAMVSCCRITDLLESDDLLPANQLNCVIGSSRPSALHWAAMVALPDICTALINRGADVNAPSVVGSPIECAILCHNAIYEDAQILCEVALEESKDWRWESRKKAIKDLIIAGADLKNIDVIDHLYQHWVTFAFRYDEKDTNFFQFIFDQNPTFSIESLSTFLQYTRHKEDARYHPSEMLYDDASLPVEFLTWAARTNFAHFAPDTLPLFLVIIHDDLSHSNYSPSSLELFLDIEFLGISRNNRADTTPISQEHTGHWITKLSASMLEFIRSSRVNSPNCLEKIISKILAFPEIASSVAVLGLIFRLGNNNIVLDFNWRNEVGNTILHEFLEGVKFKYRWKSAHSIILTAVLQHQANLTISNNMNITPIELLISRSETNSDEMLSIVKIWQEGDVSSACEKNPGLLERLLHAANSVDKVEYIFGQLAKDLGSHIQLLQDILARYCTVDYMKELFSLRIEDGLQKDYISAPEEESSYEERSDEGGSDEEGSDDRSSVVESFDYAFSVVNTEDVPTDKTLAESGGSLAVDEKTRSYLHLLSGSHDSADFWELRLLLAHEPDLEIRNHQDLTPLAIAIRSKNLRAMYALLISGANIGARLSHRQTYLHLACCLGNEEAVWALLSAGADTSHKDDYGNTAEDLAAIIGRSDIVDLFPRKGDHGSSAGSHYSEYSTNEYLDGDLSNGEETDISDSGQLPPLSTPQDLAFRPKSSQSTSTLGE